MPGRQGWGTRPNPKWSTKLLRAQPQGTTVEPILGSVFNGDILRRPTNALMQLKDNETR